MNDKCPKCGAEKIGQTPNEDYFECGSHISKATGNFYQSPYECLWDERDAWRAATGLANMTPAQAGDRLDEIEEAAVIMSEMVNRFVCEVDRN